MSEIIISRKEICKEAMAIARDKDAKAVNFLKVHGVELLMVTIH